jgi:NADPH:quinone reductase-like Zn-dependent oxidoreductase
MSIQKEDLRAVRVNTKATSADDLAPTIEKQSPPALQKGEALVRVRSAGVNPSDVKAALGIMPQAVFPRTPGRDFAGVVVEGPSAWIGKEVWGSGGDVGITRNGSHAGWLVLPEAALREKPKNLSFEEAGSVGVPFITAYEGFRRSGMPQRGQTVAIMGANGKVGQAAVQLAAQAGANVIAVLRGKSESGSGWDGPSKGVHTIDAKTEDVAARIRELSEISGGKGADIVFNTVGSPYFEAANKAMAKGATQIFISTIERPVPFDIFTFYRGMHTYVGIDTLALDCIQTNERMQAMCAGFEAGTLHPFTVAPDAIFKLDQVLAVYREVLGGASRRVVLNP